MNYKIIYDKGNRLRVRYGAYAFDRYSAMGLEQYLETFDYIDDVKISTSNGSVLIYYK